MVVSDVRNVLWLPYETESTADVVSLQMTAALQTYPLPGVDDFFDPLQGAKVFSSIDLQSAYTIRSD